MTLRKITQDIIRDDEFRLEIKANFLGENLGDDLSFKTQYEKFKNYKFEEYFNEINELYNYKSVSEALFYYTYKLNNENRNHLMYHTQLTIFDDNRQISDFVYKNEQNEGTVNSINSTINACFYCISDIKIMVSIETTFYKTLLNRYFEDEDEEEEEYDDYLPPLELPFFQDKCVVCLEYKPSILILPCLHICHCITCDEEGLMNKCPMCRKKIDRKIIITK